MGKSSVYSLKKSRKVLLHANSLYKKQWKKLSRTDLAKIEEMLHSLDEALMAKDREEADRIARDVEAYAPTIMRKSRLQYGIEVGVAILFALLVAVVVRQVWFELYEIPSGSMRPTLEEQDRTVVTKTAFGLNIPLVAKHFYFNPDLVKRTGVFIFRPEHIDLPDANHLYFFLFPGKKRYIKRNMGKPGDTVYFYGGKIYGIDAEGNDLPELRQSPELEKLEHVPFLGFEGRVSAAGPNTRGMHTPVFLYQMDQALARLTLRGSGEVRGHIFNGEKWVLDEGAASDPTQLTTYSDFWGFKNYAMARLLTPEEAIALGELPTELVGQGPIYLELRHTPNLHWPKPHLGRDAQGRIRPMLTPSVTVIPLQQVHLDRIMDNIYTSRFQVQDGYAFPSYLKSHPARRSFSPRFRDLEDGEYEMYYGKAYKIGIGGVRKELGPDHPLYSHNPANVQRLYNLGIEMVNSFQPTAHNHVYYPSRYAYFRDGDLYLLGAPVLLDGEPALRNFLEREQRLASESSSQTPYIPFVDHGAPLDENGEIDVDFIRTFGLKIPEKMYLALGDNHASSADSREFGFVPQENIRGTPLMILSPPGPRWGIFHYPSKGWFNLSRIIVYIIVAIALVWWWIHRRRRNRGPIFHKRSPY